MRAIATYRNGPLSELFCVPAMSASAIVRAGALNGDSAPTTRTHNRKMRNRANVLGVKVLKSPPRSPMANAICETVTDTIRRECLDWLIPQSEAHLPSNLKSWIPQLQYRGPHMALGHGFPDAPATRNLKRRLGSRHRFCEEVAVRANSALGGRNHEYFLAPRAASLSICGSQVNPLSSGATDTGV